MNVITTELIGRPAQQQTYCEDLHKDHFFQDGLIFSQFFLRRVPLIIITKQITFSCDWIWSVHDSIFVCRHVLRGTILTV